MESCTRFLRENQKRGLLQTNDVRLNHVFNQAPMLPILGGLLDRRVCPMGMCLTGPSCIATHGTGCAYLPQESSKLPEGLVGGPPTDNERMGQNTLKIDVGAVLKGLLVPTPL